MSNVIHTSILAEIVEGVRLQGLRYSEENDVVQAGDFSDKDKARSKDALAGYSLAYMHLIEIAQHVLDNYDSLVAVGKSLGVDNDNDDSAYPGNYL